jgi:hypothetical protein
VTVEWRVDGVLALVKPLGASLIDTRDRAIPLVGFAGAMRRSQLSALDTADVAETGEGLRISLGRSKTDQEGPARPSASPTAPTR